MGGSCTYFLLISASKTMRFIEKTLKLLKQEQISVILILLTTSTANQSIFQYSTVENYCLRKMKRGMTINENVIFTTWNNSYKLYIRRPKVQTPKILEPLKLWGTWEWRKTKYFLWTLSIPNIKLKFKWGTFLIKSDKQAIPKQLKRKIPFLFLNQV